MRTSLLNLVILLASLSPLVASGVEAITWQTDLEAAKRAAAQTNRLVLIHFWNNGCMPCAKMDQDVFSLPAVGQTLSQNFILVKICTSQQEALARSLDIKTVPSDVVMTASGQVLSKTSGYAPATEYVAKLNQVAAQARQSLVARAPGGGLPNPNLPGAIPQAPAANNPYSTDQYNAYLQQHGHAAAPTAMTPQVNYGQAPGYASAPPTPAANAFPTSPVAANPAANAPVPPPAQQGIAKMSYAAPPAATAAPRTPIVLPSGWPPLAMDGQCPVTITEQRRWQVGQLQFAAVHQGRTYLCAGQQERDKLLSSPFAYVPALDGNDPVLAADQRQTVPGSTMFGVTFHGHTYLFAGVDTLERFRQDPRRYAADVMQASRPTGLEKK